MTDLKEEAPAPFIEQPQQAQQQQQEISPFQLVGSKAWSPLFEKIFSRLIETPDQPDAPKASIGPISHVLRRVIDSRSFKQHLERVSGEQITKSFFVQTLCQYICSTLPIHQLVELARYMESQLQSALKKIFKRIDAFRPTAHTDVFAARLFVLLSALHRQLPTLNTTGASSVSRSPVVYLTDGSPWLKLIDRLSWHCSLVPRSSFRVIPLRRTDTPKAGDAGESIATYAIDLTSLEREIQADKALGRLPIAVLCVFGADLHQACPYQFDDIEALRKLCDRHSLWLHAEGTGVLLTAANNGPTGSDSLFDCSDSVVCEPMGWFGLNGPLALSLVRPSPLSPPSSSSSSTSSDTSTSAASPPPTVSPPAASGREAVTSLFPLWYLLHAHPERDVNATVESCLKLGETLSKELGSPPHLMGPLGGKFPHQLFFQLRLEEVEKKKKINLQEFNLDINGLNRWIYHRLVQRNSRGKWDLSPSPSSEATPITVSPSACSALFETALSQTSYQGKMGFLFHPVTSYASPSCVNTHLEENAVIRLVQVMKEEVELVMQAGRFRAMFEHALNGAADLTYVPSSLIPSDVFVGVGAFRFVPQFSLPTSHIDALNALLAHELAKISPMFVGVDKAGPDRSVCIVIQTGPEVLQSDGFIDQLIATLTSTVAKLEMPPEVQQSLAKVIEAGIKQAEEQLQQQSTSSSSFNPDSLIRKIPVVGSLWSWIAPSPKAATTTLEGHTFDIRSRELKSVALQRKDHPILLTPSSSTSSLLDQPKLMTTVAAPLAAAAAAAGAGAVVAVATASASSSEDATAPTTTSTTPVRRLTEEEEEHEQGTLEGDEEEEEEEEEGQGEGDEEQVFEGEGDEEGEGEEEEEEGDGEQVEVEDEDVDNN